MKKKMIAALVCGLCAFGTQSRAQETYGHTLNIGPGIAYFGYIGQSVPYLTANYEFDVAKNFTIAPFIGLASYRVWDHHGYYFHRTIIPVGVKGVYYLDNVLGANPKWDFYVGASLGFNINRVTWDDGYYDASVREISPLYLDGHLGAEYHLDHKMGLFMDVSTGVSTFGLAVHSLGGKTSAKARK